MAATQRLHWAWVILGICFVDLFINYSVRLGYGVILPEMIQTLEIGRAAAGSIFNSYFFTYLAITPFTGYLTDRIGARSVITACLLILGLAVLFMGTVETLWSACLVFGFVGVGASGMWTPLITLAQRWFAFHRRGLALGIMGTGYGLGFAAMGLAFPWVVANYSWRHAWYILGGMALAMVAVNGLFLKSDPIRSGYQPWGQGPEAASGSQDAKASQMRIPFGDLFKDRRFWLIGCSYLAIAYCLYGITTYMVDYARYQLSFPLEKASFLATIHGLGQIVGVLTLLPLSDYLGRKVTIIISNAVITICLGSILLAGDSWILLCAIIGCLAVFYGITFPIYGAAAGDYFPRGSMGTVIGAWTPLYGTGAIMSHWVTGLLRDASGNYNQPFLINVLMGLMALIFISLVRKK